MNLYHFLKLNKFQGLSMGLIRRFSMQILQALAVLRKAQVIHCDLKPENILLKSSNRSAIKVIDFGSSCFSDKKIYTYIQSRFYRAPEVILGISYTTGIDMWSFGCILCELFTGYPLFPGENETQQLLMIVELIGYPGTEVLAKASRKKLFFDSEDRLKVVQDSKGRARQPASRKIERVLQGAEPEFVDLVQRCLVWNPSLRITPEEALAAQWIGDVCKKGKNGPQAESCKNLKRQQFDFTD
jgi:serine/threonine protein kinase